MKTATISLWIIAIVLAYIAWRKADGSLQDGLVRGWQTFKKNAALLLIAFIIVGYVNVLSPTGLIQDWIGPNTGFRGLVLAEIVGMLLPGGPYAIFPIIAILYNYGAGLGPAVTIITSWATQALLSVSFEIPFMGWRFSIIRWGLGLWVPIFTGAVALLLFD